MSKCSTEMNKFLCIFIVLFSLSCTSCQGKLANSTFSWDKEFPLNWMSNAEIVAQVLKTEKCSKNIPLDPQIVADIAPCIKADLSIELYNETLSLLDSGETKKVGSIVCRILPKLNLCYAKIFSYLEDCRDEKIGTKENIDGFIRNYLCATSERKEYIGMFLYHLKEFAMAGGLKCFGVDDLISRIEKGEDIQGILKTRFGNDFQGFIKCMDGFPDAMQTGDKFYCDTLKRVQNCGKTAFFGNCDSPKPWESVSEGLKAFEDVFKCKNFFHSEL